MAEGNRLLDETGISLVGKSTEPVGALARSVFVDVLPSVLILLRKRLSSDFFVTFSPEFELEFDTGLNNPQLLIVTIMIIKRIEFRKPSEF